VTRETVRAEGIAGGFAGLYAELSKLETLGTARRGYFVESLGGAQFALGAAVERLRSLRGDDDSARGGALVIAATDPANPFGAALPWPKRDYPGRGPARVPGAHVVTIDGEPVLYVERGGRNLVPLAEDTDLREALQALADHVHAGRLRQLAVERFDSEPVVGSAIEPLLIELGFRQGPRKLTLSA
jgi:ATP-dependent Lhr-like helicase